MPIQSPEKMELEQNGRSTDIDIETPKTLAAAFACEVTVPSSNQMDWVARKGSESIFETLSHILPEV